MKTTRNTLLTIAGGLLLLAAVLTIPDPRQRPPETGPGPAPKSDAMPSTDGCPTLPDTLPVTWATGSATVVWTGMGGYGSSFTGGAVSGTFNGETVTIVDLTESAGSWAALITTSGGSYSGSVGSGCPPFPITVNGVAVQFGDASTLTLVSATITTVGGAEVLTLVLSDDAAPDGLLNVTSDDGPTITATYLSGTGTPTLVYSLSRRIKPSEDNLEVSGSVRIPDGDSTALTDETVVNDSDYPEVTVATVTTVSGAERLTLTFSDAVRHDSGAGDGATLTASGGAVTAAYASGNGTTAIVYSLSRRVYPGETLTTAGTIRDDSDDSTVTWSAVAVTNSSTATPPDSTPPTVTAASVASAGTTVALTLSESGCLPASGIGGFTLAGTSATVASWSISGTTLTLTLTGKVYAGQTVTVAYNRSTTTDDVSDAAGNFLASFGGRSVTNGSTAAPLVAGSITLADSDETSLTLAFTGATGGTGTITDQVQVSADGLTGWSDLAGGTSSPVTESGLTGSTTRYYRLRSTDADATATSGVYAFTTDAPPGPPLDAGVTATLLHPFALYGSGLL